MKDNIGTNQPARVIEDLEKERLRCAALVAIVQRLAYAPNLRTAMEIVSFSFADVLKFAVCAHVLVRQGKVMRYLYIYPDTSATFLERTKAATSRSPILTFDHFHLSDETPIEEYAFGSATENTASEADDAFSLIEAPIRLGQETLGLISVSVPGSDAYTERDQEFLDTVAKGEAIAFSRYQSAIESEWQRMETLAQNMTLGIVVVDAAGQVVVENPRAREILGMPKAHQQMDLIDLKNFFGAADYDALIRDCVRSGRPVEANRSSEATEAFYHVFISPIETGGVAKETRGIVIIFEDITEEKLLERTKSEFVSIASHQLRTPLTVIKGNLEMLHDESFGPLNEEQRNMITETSSANERLISLVNEMLDIGRMERGSMQLVLAAVDIAEIADSVARDLDGYAAGKGVKLSIVKSGEIPKVLADELRLRQVLQNLIDNAIRYRKPSGGVITVSLRPSGKSVQLMVADEGIGIPKAEQKRLFERFYRASNAVKAVGGGTGLGLYIVKAIVEQFKGSIAFISKEDKGTTFTVTLPVAE